MQFIRQQCAAVIPCHNEAGYIGEVVRGAMLQVPSVFVVDDGSSDATGWEAANAGATVLRHEQRLGKGMALRSGLSAALKAGFSWALILDGDGQHRPEDAAKFFEAALCGDSHLIVGNRMIEAHKMPRIRRYVNRFMSAVLSVISRRLLPDSQCGYRLMELTSWARVQSCARHFEIDSDVLLGFARAGHQITFVPIRVIYGNEYSKIAPLRDTCRWFAWLARSAT